MGMQEIKFLDVHFILVNVILVAKKRKKTELIHVTGHSPAAIFSISSEPPPS
jgi:hypothetical protein